MACTIDTESFVVQIDGKREVIAPVVEVPVTLGGAARHNVSNVLGAIAVAYQLGFSTEIIRTGLTAFEPTAENSPGRTNVFRAHGVTVMVDFAHNPEGMDALVDTVLRLPATRRLLVIGQAGDRDDESIRAFARAASRLQADRIIVKEMARFLRGREPGVVPRIIATELAAVNPTADLEHVSSELESVERALAWARPGDLLVLSTHAERDEVIERVRRFVDSATD